MYDICCFNSKCTRYFVFKVNVRDMSFLTVNVPDILFLTVNVRDMMCLTVTVRDMLFLTVIIVARFLDT